MGDEIAQGTLKNCGHHGAARRWLMISPNSGSHIHREARAASTYKECTSTVIRGGVWNVRNEGQSRFTRRQY